MGGQTFEFDKKIENKDYSERLDSHKNSNASELRSSSIQKESSGKKNNHC